MPPVPLTLFELFGRPVGGVALRCRAPAHRRSVDGPPDPSAWLGALNNSVKVANVRTGALGDRVSVEADLTVDPSAGSSAIPRAGRSYRVACRRRVPDPAVRGASGPRRRRSSSRRRETAGSSSCWRGCPVEIRLPAGPRPAASRRRGRVRRRRSRIANGEFEPGRLDDLKVILRRGEPTSIFVHVRGCTSAETYEFHVQPAVPVSFERVQPLGHPVQGRPRLPADPVARARLPAGRQEGDDLDDLPPDDTAPGSHSGSATASTVARATRALDGCSRSASVDIDEEAEDMPDASSGSTATRRTREPTAELRAR